jgi:uncharacterized protein
MKRELLAPDVTWAIPGHHPLSGVKRGAEEIASYFAQLPKANFQAEPLAIAAEGDYAADQHAADLFFTRVWGEDLKPIPERLR